MNKVFLLLFLVFSGKVYSETVCYEGIVGVGIKNVMEFCVGKDHSALTMYYFNHDIKGAPTTICNARATYLPSDTVSKFEIKSSVGECDNKRKMGSFHFSCNRLADDLLKCDEINNKMHFYFSIPKT